jgi:hypothetical protein
MMQRSCGSGCSLACDAIRWSGCGGGGPPRVSPVVSQCADARPAAHTPIRLSTIGGLPGIPANKAVLQILS